MCTISCLLSYYRSDLAENKLHKEELNLEKQKARMVNIK